MTKMNMPALQSPRLLDQVCERIRYLNYSLRTEEACVHWVKGFIRFHQRRHPVELSKAEVEAYLMFLANERKVSASTHRQALSALLFLYSKVLLVELPWLEEIGRPREVKRLPVVLNVDEVKRILQQMSGEHSLVAQMRYGTGMRILEALRLRVKDIDFGRRTIIIREAKGNKDRAVMLPATLIEPLKAQLARANAIWTADRGAALAGVEMPHALNRKYPRAGQSWIWHWVFPQATISNDPRSRIERRHHLYEQTFQRAFKRAAARACVGKPATPHTLRHSFATQVLQSGYDIRTVQEFRNCWGTPL